MDNPLKCPECGRTLLRNGVMLYGNVLTDEPPRPVARWDCPNCLVMVAGDIDAEEGWRQWEAQGNKRPEPQPPAPKPFRGAIAFEVCDQGQSSCWFGRPQDFRVKSAKWQYVEMTLLWPSPSGREVAYQIFAYARHWKGNGSDFTQLAHDDHPDEAEITRLVAETALGMGGLPVGIHWEPMAWNDPLDEDDFLDKSDNPDDFKYWEPDVEDDLDFDY